MIGPERTVHQFHILHGYIIRITDVDQSGTLRIFVRACAVPLPADPEFLPIMESVAVDGTLSGDGEAVDTIGIDKSGKIIARFPLDSGGQDGEIGYSVATFQPSALQ